MAFRKLSNGIGKWPTSIFLYKNGVSTPVKKVLTHCQGATSEVYPESPVRIRVTSNFDDGMRMRAEAGKPYPHPIINMEETSFELTVTPYPENAGWYLTFENFAVAGEGSGVIHYGTETLTIPVTQPETEGRNLRRIIVHPVNEISEPIEFSFWTDYYIQASNPAINKWSFDDQNVTDSVGQIAFANNHTEPLAFSGTTYVGDSGYAYQTKYFDDAQAGLMEASVPIDAVEHGISLSVYLRGRLTDGIIGFYEAGYSAYDNNKFAFKFTYSQPLGYIGPKGTSGTIPTTNTSHRLTTTIWNHLAGTLSDPITVAEDSEWSHSGTTWTYTSSAVSYTTTFSDSTVASSQIRRIKFYINGVQQGERVVAISNSSITAGTSWLQNIGGSTHRFVMDFVHDVSSTSNPTYIDNLSIYDYELTKEQIEAECNIIGLEFGDTPTTTPTAMETHGRLREGKPADLDAITYSSHLKAFVIDNQTIAVAGEFHDFFRNRLLAEYPTSIPAIEFNYRFIAQNWTRDYNYMYCFWELYEDYVPRIVAKYDDPSYWTIGGMSHSIIGRWQNAIGLLRIADGYDGTDLVRPQGNPAELAHFVYFRLSEPMTPGSTYTITDGDGNTTSFTYDRNEYSRAIKVNQVGYLPEAGKKYAYFGQWLGTGGAYTPSITDMTFYIVPADSDVPSFTGTMTLRGAAEGGVTSDLSHRSSNNTTYIINGENTYELDFSPFSTAGTYQIYIPGVGYSYPFEIGSSAIMKQFWTHARGMFHQRSGIAKTAPYTNFEYPEPAHYFTYDTKFISTNGDYSNCVDTEGVAYPNNQFTMIGTNATGKVYRDVKGGWFDACDFDRRPQHWICVEDMIAAYLLFPENFTDSQLDIPESGDGVPDILSEAEWCLQLWRHTQSAAGGIAMWIESTAHERDWPWLSTMKYYMAMPNRYDSMVYAYLAARFARACNIAGTAAAKNKATIYLDSAIKAFKFAIDPANRCTFSFDETNSSGVTKRYSYTESDSYLNEWYFKTAAAIYVTTGDDYYRQFLTTENYNLHYDILAGDANDFPRKICPELLLNIGNLYPDLYAREFAFCENAGNNWTARQETNTYRMMNWNPGHVYFTYQAWGVVHPETRGRIYPYLYKITGDSKWRDYGLLALDWACGCNAMGRSLTSGLGHVYPVRFLHHWLPRAEVKWGFFEAPPGITPYCHVGPTTTGNSSIFYLSKASYDYMKYSGVFLNIMPSVIKEATGNSSTSINAWLTVNRPMMRQYNEMEDTTVAMSEMTISETMSGKLFMAGCFMGAGLIQNPLWKAKTPATDRFAVDGYLFLP
jgi:hypothetical protein